jgi:hypothetical protein
MNFIEQLSAIALLVDFLFGVTFGVVGGAVHGSRRGVLLAPASDDILSAGARVIFWVCFRGYPQGLVPGDDQRSHEPREDNVSESHGEEADQ